MIKPTHFKGYSTQIMKSFDLLVLDPALKARFHLVFGINPNPGSACAAADAAQEAWRRALNLAVHPQQLF